MKAQDKIKTLRETNHWTQDIMAEKLEISKNSYAKLERGESKLNLEKLEKIAQIFNIDMSYLTDEEKALVFFVGGNENSLNSNNITHYANTNEIISENEKLKLTIEHQQQLLNEKDKEINLITETKDREIKIITEAKNREIELLQNLLDVLQNKNS